MTGSIRWVALGVGAFLVALVAVLAVGSGGLDAEGNDLLGRRVPDIEGTTLDGEPFDIDDHRGEWVVVNFFATWCPGCITEHPELVAFDEWADETGQAELVAVVFNDPAERVEAFFDENGGGWPVVDQPGVAVDFGVAQIPETFVVAPSGQVVRHFRGEVTAAALVATIEGP